MEATFWNEDVEASKEAQRLAEAFNNAFNTSKPIKFIQPVVDKGAPGISGTFRPGEYLLVEPFIGTSYDKFNSNSGWENITCGASMGALSHWTYHYTNGTKLLVDLQGVKNNSGYILTDPVICSGSQSFGCTDLGLIGIDSWFANHHCTGLCVSSWKKPRNPSTQMTVTKGTTFRYS